MGGNLAITPNIPSDFVQINQRFYDNLSRLLEADYSTDRNYQYSYDLAGNRLQEQATIGITTSTANWTYNDANQIATMKIGANPTVNMTYDNNGNQTDDGMFTYTWDRANRLKTLNNGSYNTHFAYDGNGDRHQQNVGGTITNYLNDVGVGLTQVLSQTTGANTDTFVHGLQGMHSMHNQAGDWSYALHDGLGSVRAEISATGSVVSSQSYSPYGQPFDTTGTLETPFAFTGQMLDDSGLQYHRARYYNPSMGAWASEDPFEGFYDEPMSMNRYGYVEANPINYSDPTGNCKANPSLLEVHELRCHWNAQYISEQMGIPLQTMLGFQWWELELAMPNVSAWMAEQGLTRMATAPLPSNGDLVQTFVTLNANAVGQGGLAALHATPEERARAYKAFTVWLGEEGVRYLFEPLDYLLLIRDLVNGCADTSDILSLLPLMSRSGSRAITQSFDEISDVQRAVRRVDNALPDSQRVVLDVFGGQNSQIRSIPGYEDAILVDVIAQEGVVGSALQLPFGANSIDEIVANNPFVPYPRGSSDIRDAQRLQIYEEAYRILKPDGILIINASKANRYRLVPSEINGLTLISQTPLDSRFSGLVFRRTNGSEILHSDMETLIYVRQ